jgi:hypothetical protein
MRRIERMLHCEKRDGKADWQADVAPLEFGSEAEERRERLVGSINPGASPPPPGNT